MKREKIFGLAYVLLTAAVCGSAAVAATPAGPEGDTHQAMPLVCASPALFVENRGQWEGGVRYAFEGRRGRIDFLNDGLTFNAVAEPEAQTASNGTPLAVRFRGANPARPIGTVANAARVNYYTGSDLSQWRLDVPTFEEIAYEGVYDGIDLRVAGRPSGLKYEFHCAPGASWENIAVQYDGTSGLSIGEDGSLHVSCAFGEVVEAAPFVYQETPKGRAVIPAGFRLIDASSYAFELRGAYDGKLPLVIDPELAWGTYFGTTSSPDRIRCEFIGTDDEGRVLVALTPWLGVEGDAKVQVTQFAAGGALLWTTYLDGGNSDSLSGAAFSPDGSTYLVGQTYSTNFPVVDPFQAELGGNADFFVAKVAPDGHVEYASYLGGSAEERMYPYGRPRPAVINAGGDVFIFGQTGSNDLPTPNGFSHELTGTWDFFVARVTGTGGLAWASYLPPVTTTPDDKLERLAADDAGNAFLSVDVTGDGWPTPNGINTVRNGGYLAKITPVGEMAWGTYLRAAGVKRFYPDGQGGLLVAGEAGADFPIVNAFQGTYGGSSDAFAARFATDGTLAWSSYLGGSGNEDTSWGTIQRDASGNLIVAGSTSSADFPTPNGFDTSYNGGDVDIFVAKVTPAGQLDWASYLGSAKDTGMEYPSWVTTDSSGNVFIALATLLDDYPTPGGFDSSLAGGDIYVAKVTAAGEFGWGTYLGGTDPDEFSSEALDFLGVDAAGNATLVGRTYASDFPLKDAFQGCAGGVDCFITKIEPDGGLLWSTCLGGTGNEYVRHDTYARWSNAVIGSDTSVAMMGRTTSSDFPTPNGYDTTFNGTDPGTQSVTLFVARVTGSAGPLSVITATLPGGKRGVPYSAQLAALGGAEPYAWSVTSGDLPGGLSLDAATGVIKGVPTAAGNSEFTVTVTDSQTPAASAHRDLAISIAASTDADGPAMTGVSSVPTQVRRGIDTSIALSATADDSANGGSAIAGAEYFVGADPGAGGGTVMGAADGAFDSISEALAATIDVSSWTTGSYRIYVRAKDALGNWGGVSSVLVPVVDGTPPGAISDLEAESGNAMPRLSVTVAESSAGFPGLPASRLVDGDASTSWRTAGTDAPADEYVILDLGSNINVGAVGLTAGKPAALFPQAFTIEVSSDGDDWYEVVAISGFKASKGAYAWQFLPWTTRYIRISGPGVRNASDGKYYWQIAEAAVYGGCKGSTKVELTWTAPADDGYLGAPAAAYDVHCSDSAITAANFDACTDLKGVTAPKIPAGQECQVLSTGGATDVLYFAVKAADEVPNWSEISNVATAEVSVTGFQPRAPEDGFVANVETPPTFEYAIDPAAKGASFCVSNWPGFPSKPSPLIDGQVIRTLKFRVRPGSTTWTPSAGQWKAIKSAALVGGGVLWRLQGAIPGLGTVFGPTRELDFASGLIHALAATPSHVAGSDDAVWPDAAALPTFSWQSDLPQMKYCWVDVSTTLDLPVRDRKRTVVLGASGIEGLSYALTKADWKKVRRLAALGEGTLYWRVRAKDAEKAFTSASQPVTLIVDGGQWSLSDLDLSAMPPTVSWTCTANGNGIAKYSLQFSTRSDFPVKGGFTVKVPATSITALSYSLSEKEVTALKKLAAKKGVSTLYYRVRGEDAEKAFITWSEAKTLSMP